MKTLIKLASAMLTTTLFIPLATAQTEITPEQLLPDSTDVVINVDLTTTNPFQAFIDDAQQDDDSFIRFITENPFTFAMNLPQTTEENPYPDPDMYLFGRMSEEDFNALIEELQTDGTEPTIETYNNTDIYVLDTDMYLFHYQGLDIVTSKLELAQELIDTYKNGAPSLNQNDTWKNGQNHIDTTGFADLYVNTQSALEELMNETSEFNLDEFYEELGFNTEILKTILGELISVKQTDTGFVMDLYVEGDEQQLEALDLLFDKYNFTPYLYQLISGNDIIFYTEHNNFYGMLQDNFKAFDESSEIMIEYQSFMNDLETELGFNPETELIPYLDGPNMITMHSADQTFPALTFMFEISAANEEEVTAAVNLVNSKLQESSEQESAETEENYDYSIKQAGGSSFYVHATDEFTLWLGLTSDRKLVISTHEDLPTIFRTPDGMESNQAFNSYFTEQSNTSSLFYMDFQELYQYIDTVMATEGATQADRDAAATFAAPWDDLYLETFANGGTTWGTIILNVDLELLPPLEDLLFGPTDVYEDEYTQTETSFCDVAEGAWYYDPIMELAYYGIVEGYENGCFGPNAEINRAEFTKMVIDAAEFTGVELVEVQTSVPAYFSDVNNQWFADVVNKAATNSAVKGYGDDTFRPANPITRAEALQIIYNLSPTLQAGETNNPFTDVSENDWFYNAIGSAYNNSIVSGKTAITFDPHTNITRAEAAKVIDNFIWLEWY